MKPLTKHACPLVIAVIASCSPGGGPWLKAAETNAPPERVGIYDSRVVAYAHFWSDAHQRELNALARAAREAKAAGQAERFHELNAALKKEQDKIHLQVFSTAPADDALAEIRDHLPAIQKEAGVATLVSTWDETTLQKYPRATRVDITELLLREFKLDAKRLNIARDIREKQPLPLEKAKELMRKGKL